MSKLADLLAISASSHDYLCPRLVLGVRMGMLAGQILELDLPQNDKRLLTAVETDGCFVDGVSAATGCTVGHRTLRVYDYGKVAAVFIDSQTGDAVRIVPRDALRDEACQYLPEAQSRWHAQLQGYQTMPDAVMFTFQPVTLQFEVREWLGDPGIKAVCDQCGEEIIHDRHVLREDAVLCRACAGEPYYAPFHQCQLIRP